MEHADRFLRRFYIEKGMFGSLSVNFIFYRPPLALQRHFVNSFIWDFFSTYPNRHKSSQVKSSSYSPHKYKIALLGHFALRAPSRRVWRVDFGVMEWGVMRAAIPLGCCVVGVVES